MSERREPPHPHHPASAAIAHRARHRLLEDGAEHADAIDAVAVEEPLEIRLDEDAVAVTMRTPGDDSVLVVGFLFSEGVIRSIEDLASVFHCGRPGDEGFGNVIDVRVRPGLPVPEWTLEGRRWTRSAACGVCGRSTIYDLVARAGRVELRERVDPRVVRESLRQLARTQPSFDATGGLHAAAAFDARGTMLACFEDIGRHNAVDKVIGALLREGRVGEHLQPGPRPALLAVSGRASFEIVQKAAAAKIPVVASASAASSLAIDLAEATGITLAEFVRGRGFNVYAHPERLQAEERMGGQAHGDVSHQGRGGALAADPPAEEP